MEEGRELHTPLLRGKLLPVTTEKESWWDSETVCTFSKRGNSLTPACWGREAMSEMVRQIKMRPITLPCARQHHTLTWWPMHLRSAKACDCTVQPSTYNDYDVYKYGVQIGTGGIITEVKCNENCSALSISWRIFAIKSGRWRLSFGWNAF
jgi:hypothetical protein